MMQVINVVFVTIAILIIIYAVGDFLRNININNDLEVKNKLIKIKRRMIIAIFIFVVPFALSLVVGLFSNFSNLFMNDEVNELEINNKYLDLGYVKNQDKDKSNNEYIVEMVDIIK